MERVIKTAERLAGPEVPVFAAVTIGDDVIAEAVNEVEATGIPWMHAEFIAIQRAVKVLGSRYLSEAGIYVNLEPCAFCAAIMEKVRMGGIFFGAYDLKCGAITHNARIFDYSLIKPNIVGGIQEDRCSKHISEFFERLRKQ
jgi:tRNA(Arg) A34 adenosine deaminase TadA